MHYKGCLWNALGGRLTDRIPLLSCCGGWGRQSQPAGRLHSRAFSPGRDSCTRQYLHPVGLAPKPSKLGDVTVSTKTCFKSKEEWLPWRVRRNPPIWSKFMQHFRKCMKWMLLFNLLRISPPPLTDLCPFGPACVWECETQPRPISLTLKWFLKPEERNFYYLLGYRAEKGWT